jgi:hypothetical protein
MTTGAKTVLNVALAKAQGSPFDVSLWDAVLSEANRGHLPDKQREALAQVTAQFPSMVGRRSMLQTTASSKSNKKGQILAQGSGVRSVAGSPRQIGVALQCESPLAPNCCPLVFLFAVHSTVSLAPKCAPRETLVRPRYSPPGLRVCPPKRWHGQGRRKSLDGLSLLYQER